MRLWITADVHHGINQERAALTADLARQLHDLCAPEDTVLIAGDLGGADGEGLEECLAAFAGCGGARAFVPGNHDLWVGPGAQLDSLQRYHESLPEIGRRHGFCLLDEEPLRLPTPGGELLAVAGCYGGYDFSLADLRALPEGVAAVEDGWRTGRYDGLRWNDYRYCLHGEPGRRTPLEPAPFCRQIAERFDRHLLELERDPRVRAIVALTHTAAHREQIAGHPLQDGRPAAVAEWFNGLTGSARLGAAIERSPKVRLAACGHTHHERRFTDGSGRLWLNCGATYQRKCWWSWSLEEGLRHHGWLS